MVTAYPMEILYGADIFTIGGFPLSERGETRFCPACNPIHGEIFFCARPQGTGDCLETVRENKYTLQFLIGNVL